MFFVQKKFLLLLAVLMLLAAPLQPVESEDDTGYFYDFLDEGSLYFELDVQGSIIEAALKAKAGENNVNAVALDIEYTEEIISLQSITFDESFCDLFAYNYQDEINGRVSLACGSPSPGESGEIEIGKLFFEIGGKGEAEIGIADYPLILANDGRGTNLFRQKIDSSLYIQ